MPDTPSTAADKERRLNEVLAEYLEASEAGQKPDRAALRSQHPDLADELGEFFNNLDGIARSGAETQIYGIGATVAQPAANVAALAPGTRLGDYEILAEIARGGMGVVYRARQLSLNREVALKMILSGRPEEEQLLRRFRIEAEAAARLDHPNIVPIFEVGELNGRPYFTMKFVDGGSLQRRLQDFRLPGPEHDPHVGRAALAQKSRSLAQLLATVARAVHHAHLRGILHRDLKPANILLDREQRPLVADFGLAKRVEQNSDLTQSMAVVGTAVYMAPEQTRGNMKLLTTTADVYSLGAIMYELLTGQPPLVGKSFMDTLMKVAEQNPIPPTERNPNVPADLEMICLKAIAKQPERRYSTALELAQDLERWCAGDIISLRSATRMQRTWHWARRNPMSAAMLATIAVLLVLVAIGSSVAAWNISVARDRADAKAREAASAQALAENQAQQARAARDDAGRALDAKQRVLVSSYVSNGTHALDSGDMFGALLWYGEALHLDSIDAKREEPHRIRLASVLRRCPKLVQVWFDHDPALAPAFSPDGSRVVLLRADGARIVDVASGRVVSPVLRHAAAVTRVAFSSDGRRVLTTVADGTARVWDADRGKAISPILKHGKAINWATFNLDASELVTVGPDRYARVWDIGTGKLRFELRHDLPVLFAVFSDDGKRLTTCGGAELDRPRGEVRVWNLDAKPPTSQSLSRSAVIRWATLTSDGKSVVAINARRAAHLWSLDGTNKSDDSSVVEVNPLDLDGYSGTDPTHVLRLNGVTAQLYDLGHGTTIGSPMPHGGAVTEGVFSPEGTCVATAARNHTVRVWDAASGAPLTPPLWHGGMIRHIAFSKNGQRLLTTAQDGLVRVWELPPRKSQTPLVLPNSAVPMAISSDGERVATVDPNGAILVRNTVTKVAQGLWQIPGHVVAVRFAPDDRHLVAVSDSAARVFDCATGMPAAPNMARKGGVRDVAFTPDSSHIGILGGGNQGGGNQGGGNQLEVFDSKSGQRQSLTVLQSKIPPADLLLSPDGRSVGVVLKPKHGLLWRDFAEKVQLGPFRHDGLIASAAISPDGSRIAVATSEGAYLWDSAARPAAPPLQNGVPIRKVVFSGNGRLLATLAEDHSVRVWDVQSGQPVTPLLTYEKPVVWIGLAADGRRLAVQCRDDQNYLYTEDLTPDVRPADDLVRLTQLLGGHVIDSQSGGFEPIAPALLRATWPHLRAMYPHEFAQKTE